jgi:UDP-N-acetylmuramate dehydrogenase
MVTRGKKIAQKDFSILCDSFAQSVKLDVRANEAVAPFTTFEVGGKADLLVEVHDSQELTRALMFIQRHQIPFVVLGGGSNVLITDQRLAGAVIIARESKKYQGDLSIVNETKNVMMVRADATVLNARLLKFCMENRLSEADHIAGIPGVVGGSILGNAGTKYGDFSQIVTAVKLMDGDGNIHQVDAKDIGFSYRHTKLEKREIILQGFFHFQKVHESGWKEKLKKKMAERAQTQPIHLATAGCVFKNGTGFTAGKLIEDLGLKGLRLGSAQVSETHANFIVNLGGAKFADIMQLIGLIKCAAKERRDIQLSEEICIKEGI